MPSELERLYDKHAPALFAFLLNFTRDEADTRDVMKGKNSANVDPDKGDWVWRSTPQAEVKSE